jgi:cell division protein FtsB
MAKKNKIKKLYSNISSKKDFVNACFLFIFFIVLFGLLFFANRKVSLQRAFLEAELSAIQERIAKVNKEKENLQQKMSAEEKESYLEKIAREQLNFQKKGEVVVAFPFIEDSFFDEEIFADRETKEIKKESNFWENLWLKIKN